MGKKIISINEGKLSEFKLHSIWLRERLNGSEFVDQNNLQRLYEPSLLEDNLLINAHSINKNILNVEFSDGTKGSFNIDDIYNEIKNIDVLPQKKIWDIKKDNLKIFDNNQIFENDSELTRMLKVFYQYGYVIIKNTKPEENEVINFAEKLGPVRSTNFGKLFNVVSKPNPNDLAYTALELTSHSDNPYRRPVPGIQYFIVFLMNLWGVTQV